MRALELKIPPLVGALLIVALMWLAAREFPTTAFDFRGRPYAAAVALAAGLGAAVAGGVSFRRAHTTIDPRRPQAASALVTSGIFHYTRNPMYLGLILALLGWALFLGNAVAVLGVPVALMFLTRLQIVPEERALASLYPEAYREYCAQVRRWL